MIFWGLGLNDFYIVRNAKLILPINCMKTIATTGLYTQKAVQVSPQLHLKIDFIRPIEPRQALFALREGNIQLVYNEKYCPFSLVTFNHPDAQEIANMEIHVNLSQIHFHHGQFCAGQLLDLMLDGNKLATASIAEVKHPDLHFWDWRQPPAFQNGSTAHFNADQLECFLLNLEFELLDLPFTRDYSIHKPKSGAYALEVRLYSSVEALDHTQAQQVLDVLGNLPYTFAYIKPNFYQLDPGEELENFECSFIIGDGSQFITGHFLVV